MFRWLIILIVAAGCIGSGAVACAQDNPWSGEPGRFTPYGGNGAWEPYGGYPAMTTPYGSSYSPNSVDPPLYPPNAPHWQQLPGPRPQSIYEYLPPGDVRGPGYETSTGGLRLRRALEHAWFRVDYLNWDLTGPGEDLIGAEWINANARDPVHGFGQADELAPVIPLARERDGTVRNDIGNAFLLVAEASDLSAFNFRHRNGARLNVGFPTESGQFEANIWTLQKNTDNFRVVPRIDEFGFLVLPAITLTNNGRLVDPTFDVSAPMILLDNFMHVQMGQEMYGAELNYFRKAVRDNENLHIDLIGGGRFIRLEEDLLVTGNDLRNQISPEILGVSTNYLFGPSVGVRVEWEYGILKLGADTRLTAAFNRHNNTVRTRELFRLPVDPITNLQGVSAPTTSSDDHTDFSPIHDLKLYAQVQVTHRLKVRVGYDLLNIFNVSRPQDAIVWDDSGIANGPVRIRADATNLEHFRAKGLFVGGEISLY
jgi:hypothetical protein